MSQRWSCGDRYYLASPTKEKRCVVFKPHTFSLITIWTRQQLLADDVGVCRRDNNISHWSCTRDKRGDEDVQTICRNGPGIPRTGHGSFVNDKGPTTRQGNRLIRSTRDRDLDAVNADVAYLNTTFANWSNVCASARGSLRDNLRGDDIAIHQQAQVFDNR